MKILGLLQNQWARNPARVRETLDRATPENRRTLMRYMLMQSTSGRRLRAALGEVCHEIVWDNASPIITRRSDGRPLADLAYVSALLAAMGPDLVLAFGQVAQAAVRDTGWAGPVFAAPHPAARGSAVQGQLAKLGQRIEDWRRRWRAR